MRDGHAEVHLLPAPHHQDVFFRLVRGRVDHHQGTLLVAGEGSPGKIPDHQIIVEPDRRTAGFPEALDPRLLLFRGRAQHHPTHFVHPLRNPGSLLRVPGPALAIQVSGIEPEPQPLAGQGGHLVALGVFGADITTQLLPLPAVQRPVVDQDLGHPPVEGPTRMSDFFGALGVLAQGDPGRILDVAEPVSLVAPHQGPRRGGVRPIGEVAPFLPVTIGNREVQFPVVHRTAVVDVVVPEGPALALQGEPRATHLEPFPELRLEGREVALYAGAFLLQLGPPPGDPLLLALAIPVGRQRPADLQTISPLRGHDLHRAEEGLHPVEVPGRDLVVFVIVTLGTTHGEAEEDRTDRGGHLAQHLVPGLVAPRLGEGSQPQEGHRHHVLRLGNRQLARPHDLIELVPRDLLLDELIVGLVAVERVDHVVAVSPRPRQVGVTLEPGRIGIARQVEPEARPAFAVAGIGQQPVDELLVGPGILVVHKLLDLPGSGRQAQQVEVEPAHQGLPRRLGREGQFLRFELFQDEGIDGIAHPLPVSHRGRVDPHRLAKGPLFPGRLPPRKTGRHRHHSTKNRRMAGKNSSLRAHRHIKPRFGQS